MVYGRKHAVVTEKPSRTGPVHRRRNRPLLAYGHDPQGQDDEEGRRGRDQDRLAPVARAARAVGRAPQRDPGLARAPSAQRPRARAAPHDYAPDHPPVGSRTPEARRGGASSRWVCRSYDRRPVDSRNRHDASNLTSAGRSSSRRTPGSSELPCGRITMPLIERNQPPRSAGTTFAAGEPGSPAKISRSDSSAGDGKPGAVSQVVALQAGELDERWDRRRIPARASRPPGSARWSGLVSGLLPARRTQHPPPSTGKARSTRSPE